MVLRRCPAGAEIDTECCRGGEPHERFGPTLAAEHLWTDHDLKLSVRTRRRWMLAAGLWSRRRKRQAQRKRRQRQANFGELIRSTARTTNGSKDTARKVA